MRRVLLVVCCLCLAACASAGVEPVPTGAPAEWLVIENGALVDGSGGAPVPRARVVVHGGLVAAAGPMDAVPAPAGAVVLDAGGGTILPGLVNAHVHGVADPALRRRDYLARGVTLICDAGSPWADLPALALESDRGRPTARAVAAGPVLAPPGGYPGPVHGRQYVVEARGSAAVRAAVDRLRAAGAGMLKLAFEPGRDHGDLPVFGPDEARAAVARAHALGMVARAHVEDAAWLEAALEAGVDVVDHAPVPRHGGPPVPDALLARMAARGVVMVPTLTAAVRATWDNAPLLDVVRRYAAQGGPVAAGTDAPFAGVAQGPPLEELDLLARSGLDPMAVLLAATSRAARACGRPGLGRIAPGRIADILVVDGDPLADRAALSRPRYVLVGGVPVGGTVGGVVAIGSD